MISGFRASSGVIAGPDPAIHFLRKSFFAKWMDTRVKPGHDALIFIGHVLIFIKTGVGRIMFGPI
jgi:hypothetical protein